MDIIFKAFKKFSILALISAINIAIATLFYTFNTIESHSWAEEGSARILVCGLSFAFIFIIYAILAFKAIRNPSTHTLLIVYGFQSILFFLIMILMALAVFFSIY